MERSSHKPDFGAVVDYNKMSLVSPTQVPLQDSDNYALNGKQTKMTYAALAFLSFLVR